MAERRAKEESSGRPPRHRRHRAGGEARLSVRLPGDRGSTDDDLPPGRGVGSEKVPETCRRREIGNHRDNRLHMPMPTAQQRGEMGEQKQVAQGGNTQRATVASGLVLFDRDLWGGSGTTLFERRLYLRGDGAIDLGMFAIGINGCNRTP